MAIPTAIFAQATGTSPQEPASTEEVSPSRTTTEQPLVPDPVRDAALAVEQFLTAALMRHDTNGDGAWQVTEWDTALTSTKRDPTRAAQPPADALATSLPQPADWLVDQFEAVDVNGDGNIPPAELSSQLTIAYGLAHKSGLELRRSTGEVFNWRSYQQDRDRDGDERLTLAEYQAFETRPAAESAKLFAEIDTDQDDALSLAERWARPGLWVNIAAKFRALDADQDGRLSLSELEAKLAKWESPYLPQTIPGYDSDGDGELSATEFRLHPLANPALNWSQPRTDRNHDGYLDADEFHPGTEWAFRGLSQLFFDRLDANHDDQLDLGELDYAVDFSRIPQLVAIELLDGDGDGQLSLLESLGGDASASWILPRHEMLFQRLDVDGNRVISAAEMPANGELPAMVAQQRTLWRTAAPAFKVLDVDGSGGVSEEEWLARVPADLQRVKRQDFLIADFNGDQSLSLAEFTTVRGIVPIAHRGDVPDPVVEACRASIEQLTEQLQSLGGRDWANLVADVIRGISPNAASAWDADRDGRLSAAELERGVEVAFGVRNRDGLLCRRPNGQIFFGRNLLARDVDRDGRLNHPELAAWYEQGTVPPATQQAISEADRNGDGVLTATELAELSQFWTDPLAEFRRFDVNADGGIDGDELKSAAKPWETVIATAALTHFDLNGDQRLSLTEFRLGPVGNFAADWNTKRVDENHDGRLSVAEYHHTQSPELAAVSGLYFTRLDRNHDSALDRTEADFTIDLRSASPEALFAVLDRDHDGRLSDGEVTQFAGVRPEEASKARPYEERVMRLEDAFRETDFNRDGRVDSAEFQNPIGPLAAVAAGKPHRPTIPTSAPPPATAADSASWNTNTLLLVGFNALLLGGVGWLLFRPRT